MPRVDDYINARRIAAEALRRVPAQALSTASGWPLTDRQTLSGSFLDQRFEIRLPDFNFEAVPEPCEIPIQQQVLALHYLQGCQGAAATAGDWVAYREIPGAGFYFSAFVKRALDPLKKVFGENPSAIEGPARLLGATRLDAGDVSYRFDVFPRVPLQVILWCGDDEFPSEAAILFDAGIAGMLSPEDIAWTAGLLVYRLIALSG